MDAWKSTESSFSSFLISYRVQYKHLLTTGITYLKISQIDISSLAVKIEVKQCLAYV